MSKVQEGSKEKTQYANKVPIVGAGTGVTVVCLLLLFGYQTIRQPKLAIERRVETSGEFTEKRLPTVVAILDSRTALRLSQSQIQKLRMLQEEQLRQLEPIEAQLNNIIFPIKRTDKSRSTMSMSPQEIQVIAKQISGPSRRKREIEHDFSKQAWTTLTQEQHEKALKLPLARPPIRATKGEDKKQ